MAKRAGLKKLGKRLLKSSRSRKAKELRRIRKVTGSVGKKPGSSLIKSKNRLIRDQAKRNIRGRRLRKVGSSFTFAAGAGTGMLVLSPINNNRKSRKRRRVKRDRKGRFR